MNHYDEYTDEELIDRIRRGNDKAEIALFKRYQPIAEMEARDYKSRLFDLGAREGECLAVFARCLKEFDPEKKIKFRSYCKRSMRNAMLDMIRKEVRRPSEISIESPISPSSDQSIYDMIEGEPEVDHLSNDDSINRFKVSVRDFIETMEIDDADNKQIRSSLSMIALQFNESGALELNPSALDSLLYNSNQISLFDSNQDRTANADWQDRFLDCLVDRVEMIIWHITQSSTISEIAIDLEVDEVFVKKMIEIVKRSVGVTKNRKPRTSIKEESLDIGLFAA